MPASPPLASKRPYGKVEWTSRRELRATGGAQVLETEVELAERMLRPIVRRRPVGVDGDAQLSFDDIHGWRFQAVVNNTPRGMYRRAC